MPAENPRAVCVRALEEWEKGGCHADDILHEMAVSGGFGMVDRAFLTEMFYGVLRNLGFLDFLIGQLRASIVDPSTRQILRLGLYQIFRMRIPHHAAVNETVKLAGRARPLINALLRRSIREEQMLRERIENAAPSVRHSHPAHLIARWEREFGLENAIKLCEWNNLPAPIYVRANTLKVSPGELLRSTDDADAVPMHPLAIKVRQIPFSWITNGLCYIQDPSTLFACDLLAPQPGERVLDVCAAPGGKTSHMAQMMRNEGELVACDVSPERLSRLKQNLDRLGVANATIVETDWLQERTPFPEKYFDRILIDSPCSNTGVMRRKVDVRWRLRENDFTRMSRKQITILKKLAPLLRPGGALVYSTCSLEAEENEKVVECIASDMPELRLAGQIQTLPFRDGIDGAFAARFEKP